jgi:hypothetical protein
MKTLLTTLCLLLSLNMKGQSNCATISDGTYGNTQTSSFAPVYGLYNYSWSSSIYTAGNIGTSKTISYISWYVDEYQSGYSQTGPYTYSNIKIWFAYTTLSGWTNITNVGGLNRPTGVNAAQGITSWTKVFDGSVTFSGCNYWQYIPLDIPFSYDGVTNLIVHVENWDGAWGYGYPAFHYTSTSASSLRTVKYGYQDASMGPTTGTRAYQRPDIQFCEATPLPITLISFDVIPSNEGNLILWDVASQHNNDYYTIERSDDGIEFREIAQVPGDGTATYRMKYSYYDEDFPEGINYYRLKQTDFNGKFEYFYIISADNRGRTIKEIVGYFNELGQVIDIKKHSGLYYILYSDGTTKKGYM